MSRECTANFVNRNVAPGLLLLVTWLKLQTLGKGRKNKCSWGLCSNHKFRFVASAWNRRLKLGLVTPIQGAGAIKPCSTQVNYSKSRGLFLLRTEAYSWTIFWLQLEFHLCVAETFIVKPASLHGIIFLWTWSVDSYEKWMVLIKNLHWPAEV